ncbi:MAG: OmpA family protein [Bacteroidetes bacterium]|nr:OmpA family protein [Bacteroidota bacterium]MBS1540621.1 OmpA family protein [Bacteroidota bacterium]
MKTLVSAILILIGLAANAQQDTLVIAEGNITSAATQQPVVAKISYKSLPYGSKMGFLSGSTYSFPLFDGDKYSIEVEATGYAPVKYILDPAEANAEKKVVKNIELGLPIAKATIAQEPPLVKKLVRLHTLNFNVGTANILPASFPELDSIGKMLVKNPKMIIQLEGHTDIIGQPAANMKLSQERVDAVKAYLIRKGANKNNVKTKAFGGTQPISTEDTEAARKLNRRVELRVLDN